MITLLRRWLYGNHASFQLRELDEHRGAVVHHWAAIESSIDQANYAAWRVTLGAVSKVVPQSLRWKLGLFKKLHVEVPLFQPLRAEAETILAALKAHQEIRHFLVHGYIQHDHKEGWLLTKHVFERDGSLTNLNRRFTDSELHRLRRNLLDLQNQTTRYLNALSAECDKHFPHQTGS